MDDLDRVLTELADGPKSSRELNVAPEFLRELKRDGSIKIDPDRWPDEYVPGNPMIARLPECDRPWPGWSEWNI